VLTKKADAERAPLRAPPCRWPSWPTLRLMRRCGSQARGHRAEPRTTGLSPRACPASCDGGCYLPASYSCAPSTVQPKE
jgi:hypothetical protein